eukprot:1128016-Pyramimonas_sp.AAC.1
MAEHMRIIDSYAYHITKKGKHHTISRRKDIKRWSSLDIPSLTPRDPERQPSDPAKAIDAHLDWYHFWGSNNRVRRALAAGGLADFALFASHQLVAQTELFPNSAVKAQGTRLSIFAEYFFAHNGISVPYR